MAIRSQRQLLLEVDANVELARRALDTLDRDIGRNTSSIDRSLARIDNAFGKIRLTAGGLLAGVGVGVLGREFLGLADQAKQMQAQLQLATAEFGNLGQAQKDVERIAGNTRNGLVETSNLYGNFVRASQEAGRTQDDAARATEAFSLALKIGGASADEARSATLQFGQALASGVLRGDEFNSIMEASPRIARLLADSLGVPIGALRAMAAEGKLTREVLFNALGDGNLFNGLKAEFAQLPKTWQDAMTEVENSAISTFGGFDRGGQFSTAIANFVSDGADGFSGLSDRAEQFGIDVRSNIDGLIGAFDPFVDAGLRAFDALTNGSKQWALVTQQDIDTVLGGFDRFTNWLAQQGMLGAWLTGNDPNSPKGTRTGTTTLADFTGNRDASRQSLTDAQSLRAIRERGVSFDSQGLSIAGLSPTRRTALTTATGSGGRSGRTAARKPTDADLSPMQLILRDIGKQELPMGIADALWNPPELVDAQQNLAAMEKSLAAIDGISGQIDIGAILKAEDQERLEEFQKDFARDMTASIADAIVYADSLGDALENAFKRAAAALLESGLMEIIAPGGNGGGLFRGFLSNVGGLFGGFRAGGGPVAAGRAYVVGEKRPELFVPNVPGMIVPDVKMLAGGGSQQVTQHFSINAQGAVLAQGLIAEMQAIGARAAVGGSKLAQREMSQRQRRQLY